MWYQREGDLIKLFIDVQPGAKVTEVVGIYQDALKIRLQAPPIDGKANHLLQKFLANLFKVPRKQVKLVYGEKNRKKVFEISGSLVESTSIIETTGIQKST